MNEWCLTVSSYFKAPCQVSACGSEDAIGLQLLGFGCLDLASRT